MNMPLVKVVNGEEVPLSEAELQEYEARQAKAAQKQAEFEEWKRLNGYKQPRQEEFKKLDGDLLDALCKTVELLPDRYVPQEMKDMLAQRALIKQDNPKPDDA